MHSRHIPADYLSKLEAARATGAMAGERRVITMLFCDVKGSTEFAEELDPEEWAEIMSGIFDILIPPIYQYEGVVARLMGDAILAFFGAPITHEDDPQRAILAGLQIVNDLQPARQQIRREYGQDINVRVGINTGLVVVGEIGSDLQMEYTAMGDAINLASRMELSARPGTVQIAEDTYRLVKPLFDFEDLGEIEVKGKSEPVRAYCVLGPKAKPGRLRGIEGLNAPLIGREPEFSRLRQAMLDVIEGGQGRIIFLTGEAGLGKSRMIDELHSEWLRLGAMDNLWLESRALAYDSSRPYSLFLQQMRHILGVKTGDSPELIREKIAQSALKLPEDQRPILAQAVETMLAVSVASDEPVVQGEVLKRHLFEAVLKFWRTMGEGRARVMVFDDLHWGDPISIELIAHLLQIVRDEHVLIFCASRPEPESPGCELRSIGQNDYSPYYREIELKPLSESDSSDLIVQLLTIPELPANVIDLVLQKAEGNPFFVEEVIRTLIDEGVIVRSEDGLHWRRGKDVNDVNIPGSLQALLIARIDRLERETRRTLQLASVIGRSFYYHVLHMLDDLSASFDERLATLQEAALIQEARHLPEIEYIFRHQLTQEATYQSILLRERRRFHQRVAEVIEQLYPDRLEDEAVHLAFHFAQARNYEHALKYYRMAADAAARLYANMEATAHYAHAIEMAERSAAPNAVLIDLYTRRGRVQELGGRYADALAGYQQLESVAAEKKSPDLELAAVILQTILYATYTTYHDPDRARALAEGALELATELGDYRAQAKAYWELLLVQRFGYKRDDLAVPYGEKAIAIAREHGLKEELAYALHDISYSYLKNQPP